MAIIDDSDVTDFIRSLVGEPDAEYWTDAEISLYKKFGMMAVMSKYWYLLMPTEAQVAQTSLVASTEYVALPGNAVGDAVFTGSGLNDATFGGTYTHTADLRYVVKIDDDSASPETFTWSKDGGTSWQATGVNCAVTATTLDNGVTVTFAATTGHTDDEYWESDCIVSDCAKVLRVEVAEDRKALRKIEADEVWKYSVYDDGAASSNYLNVWYLKYYDSVTEFPLPLRPLIAFEAVAFARAKDGGLDAPLMAIQQRFEEIAITFLSTDSPYEATIFSDYEQDEAFTRDNPCAWAFKSNKIYLYKDYDESD